MAIYAAFIRGIMPTNPNHANAKLRAVFEGLGFTNVRTVITSGNILFESDSKSVAALESKIEKALSAELGITGAAHVRSKQDLEALIKKDPFKGKSHSRETYLIVTFMKEKPRQTFNTIKVTEGEPPKFMNDLEKKYGKTITTRTWKTIGRIVDKMP
ncbi:MAG: hypothetical protein JWO00_309 [Candidatus Parcubacteria bacterium]|nr:hypothetical protein [Candidatus Parcubacteria bacterium]